ncbi:peptide-methionine (S)-S-oxide reductase MsrA [Pelagicoccus enzymogenes]|uniref:peptide-methionine (S)-S-oxide reductase MsrA n=1 Tax=Pelagicoccus enzymogenes TaxID=2773457 RepID=UPI00280DEE49|nr:peptide-methionine (S)-S-oxide reductase MsrA [Pelagicoccus enzymogenes]MDQ8198373.1 peptide-methionine (S)-S-oxide reductase MsrA [Pelagicoccus enzymogenes]
MRKRLALALGLHLLSRTLMATDPTETKELETITLGAGCFWCVEAVYQRLEGVESAVSGYMGGHVENPTYKAVTTGRTGHAEVVQVKFDPKVTNLRTLIDFFWEAHDPTTLNRQGADVGTQYRSAIFYENEEQKKIAEASLAAASEKFSRPIVTEISAASAFYEAEDYHQEYYELNKSYPYCRAVITPKLKKLGLE